MNVNYVYNFSELLNNRLRRHGAEYATVWYGMCEIIENNKNLMERAFRLFKNSSTIEIRDFVYSNEFNKLFKHRTDKYETCRCCKSCQKITAIKGTLNRNLIENFWECLDTEIMHIKEKNNENI